MSRPLRRKRPRGRDKANSDLMLAALVDMLVNILIFLLHLYGKDPGTTATTGLELAESTSETPVAASVVVAITQELVTVGGTPVASLEEVTKDPTGLKTVLQKEWDRSRTAPPEPGADPDEPPTPQLVLEIDRRIPWTSLHPVLKTAGAVGFSDLRFVVATVSEHPGLPAPP